MRDGDAESAGHLWLRHPWRGVSLPPSPIGSSASDTCRTFSKLWRRLYGCDAMTAATNIVGVFDLHHLPVMFVRKLVDASVSDIGVEVVKSGGRVSLSWVKVDIYYFKKEGSVTHTEAKRYFVIDVLYGEREIATVELLCIRDLRTSAIASNMENGSGMVQSGKRACRYVEAGIETSTHRGHGNEPINHSHSPCLFRSESPIGTSLQSADFACGYRSFGYVLKVSDPQEPWMEHTEHVFVAGLAEGILPVDSLRYYLVQD
ncbi:phosphomethylpyrimidine kinase [Diplocarpon rosae]|nr:phosphomethylpyrimidine kinase [Diplocarpon rosae]